MGFYARHELLSPSGARITMRWREAMGAARGIVHISHGLGEEAETYAKFADLLAARGFHVYAHDHRGHGQTRAADTLKGHFGGGAAAQKVLVDMGAVLDLIEQRHPGLPIIVFGHAAGGLIALNVVLQQPDRVFAFAWWDPSAPRVAFRKRAMLAWERFRLGSDVPSRAMIGAGPPVSVGTWLAIVAMQNKLERREASAPASRQPPTLILSSGGNAPAARRDAEAIARRLRKTGFTDVTLRHDRKTGAGEGSAATLGDWAQSLLD